jgi:hypothetical protein
MSSASMASSIPGSRTTRSVSACIGRLTFVSSSTTYPSTPSVIGLWRLRPMPTMGISRVSSQRIQRHQCPVRTVSVEADQSCSLRQRSSIIWPAGWHTTRPSCRRPHPPTSRTPTLP